MTCVQLIDIGVRIEADGLGRQEPPVLVGEGQLELPVLDPLVIIATSTRIVE